jgi:hypothetical protein
MAKFTHKLVDPDDPSTYMNDAMIFYFCSLQGDYLLFLARPHQGSSREDKHISKSGILIIIVAIPVGLGEAD